MSTRGLYVYNNGPRGDVMFCRAVYRLLAQAGRGFDLAIGACRDDAPLLADLRAPRCQVLASELPNTAHGAIADLEHLCPPGFVPLEVWLGGGDEVPSYQWADVVASLREDLCERQLEAALDLEYTAVAEHVPMLDFRAETPVALPELRRPAIWIEGERTARTPCWFVFDLERLADVLPGFDLFCTVPGGARCEAVVDVSRLGPIERQKTSERCAALVGTTMDPFLLTLSEANRWKPKALCGHDARVTGVPWDYPGNPLELLGSMDELVDHLLANLVIGAGA